MNLPGRRVGGMSNHMTNTAQQTVFAILGPDAFDLEGLPHPPLPCLHCEGQGLYRATSWTKTEQVPCPRCGAKPTREESDRAEAVQKTARQLRTAWGRFDRAAEQAAWEKLAQLLSEG